VRHGESLIAPGVIATALQATLEAFADHGGVARTLDDGTEPERVLKQVVVAGIDLEMITADMERDGIDAFCRSYQQVLSQIEHKITRGRGCRLPRSQTEIAVKA
jgi:transaldolase